MRILLRLAIVLAILALVAWAAGAQEISLDTGPYNLAAIDSRGVVPVGPRKPVSPVAVAYPRDGVFVYNADPRCSGASNVLPDLAVAVCMREHAAKYLIREVQAGRVRPGPAWRDCTYPSDPAWNGCVEYSVNRRLPEIRFGRSPFFVSGAIGGVPWTGCAAGIAYPDYIRVSLADQSRVYRLCAWETSNSLLAYLFDLSNSADGPITAAATDYAATACGVL